MKINQSGSTQALLCLLLLLSLSGITAITLKKIVIFKENKLRLSSLLCMRKSHYYQAKLIAKVNQTNKLIKIAYYASKSPFPQIALAARNSLIALKAKQSFDLIEYYKHIYSLKSCSKITKISLVTSSLYQMKSKVIFKRSLDNTTIINRQKMHFIYSCSKSDLLLSIPPIFKSRIEVDSNLSTNTQILTHEIPSITYIRERKLFKN